MLCGAFVGTTNVADWLDLLLKGFGDAGSWVIVMLAWVSAFGGIMNAMDAFAPVSKLVVKLSRNVQQLMGWCGILCLAGNVALADEAAQVATMSPIIRDIVAGIPKNAENYVVIENRIEAIHHAMDIAEKDDIIVLAGKGHETYQEINKVKHHLDEREVVADYLQERG